MPSAPLLPTSVQLARRTAQLSWCRVVEASADALSPAELALQQRGKSAKRRQEFCAGRVAARQAVLAAAPPGARFEVLACGEGPDAGRPVVVPDCGISLSISHSGQWAAAVAAAGPSLGLDLEAADLATEASFAREAFAPGELEGWRLPAELAGSHTAIAWAAKEAALKVWGVGLRAPLGSVSLQLDALGPGPDGWQVALRLLVTGSWPALGPAPQRLGGTLALVPGLVMVLLEAL